jgi:hypothetical protein
MLLEREARLALLSIIAYSEDGIIYGGDVIVCILRRDE